jgi:hypothetical protein
MPIRVDAYMAEGVASGWLAHEGPVREQLEHDGVLAMTGVQWQPLDGPARPAGDLSIPIDDVFVAVAEDDPTTPVHASWHGIRVELGPYVVEGEMPTLPGFDPGRALTRPTGEFVLLRDVSLGLRSAADAPTMTPLGHHALVNRYVVETVACDLMLGFFFPGATIIQAEVDAESHAGVAEATEAPEGDLAPAGLATERDAFAGETG